MDKQERLNILEAVLMSSETPLALAQLLALFEGAVSKAQLLDLLSELQVFYANRSIALVCLAGGYCFQTKPLYASWIQRCLAEKPAHYSQALLEVLAIIAYRQPVTCADIEHIRGVSVSRSILKTLLDREWIHTVGQRPVPGRPTLYATTVKFLNDFNVASLEDLPSLDNNV